jgi:hypothetical protein
VTRRRRGERRVLFARREPAGDAQGKLGGEAEFPPLLLLIHPGSSRVRRRAVFVRMCPACCLIITSSVWFSKVIKKNHTHTHTQPIGPPVNSPQDRTVLHCTAQHRICSLPAHSTSGGQVPAARTQSHTPGQPPVPPTADSPFHFALKMISFVLVNSTQSTSMLRVRGTHWRVLVSPAASAAKLPCPPPLTTPTTADDCAFVTRRQDGSWGGGQPCPEPPQPARGEDENFRSRVYICT